MSTLILRPNAVRNSPGAEWSAVPGGTMDDVTSDDNLSTYLYHNSTKVDSGVEFEFDNCGLPAGAVINSVQMFAHGGSTFMGTSMSCQIKESSGTTVGFPVTFPDQEATGQEVSNSPVSTPSDGNPWEPADLDGLYGLIFLTYGAANPESRVNEFWIEVDWTNQAPSATVTAPSGNVTDTNTPEVVWSYSDLESDTQTQYHVKVFTEDDTLDGSFDPDTWTATWDSGTVADSGTSATVDDPLGSDINYVAYVRVADAGDIGFGDWDAGSAFTILSSGVDTPTRVFFAQSSLTGTNAAGFWEFDDDNREGSFSFKSAPLRDPRGRQLEIREVQVYAESYDGSAEITVTVNGTAKTETMTATGRHQLIYNFRERGEVLDVKVESNAGNTATGEAPSIEALRIGFRPGHLLP